MVHEKDREKILKHITREEVGELTKQLVDIPSPTGAEREIGEFILDWYSRHGIKPVRQQIDPNRINAVGGVELKGDLILAAVSGEISRTPIGPYQFGSYQGEGTGTRYLLTHGVQSDYAIVADRSGHSIVWTQNGVAQFRISTFGDPHAAWGVSREQEPPEKSNAILKMVRLAQAIDAWAEQFEPNHVYESANGPAIPKVNIGAIQGGAPFRPNYYPGVCSLYVDVRTPPDLRPVQVKSDLKKALSKTGVEYELEMYASLMGYEARGIEPVVKVIEESYQTLCGQKPPPANTFRASIWTDTNVYNEMGIPACKFGLGGKKWAIRSEQIEIEEIFRGAQVYALAAAEICNWQR